MDEMVLRALAKWPNVPAVFGWLTLDRRGNWLIKGERISNPTIPAFIGRNYERDSEGRWFFQNGPQRVYASLEYTPLVYRVLATDTGMAIEAHTGEPVTSIAGAYVDDAGALLLHTELAIGIVHDHDLENMLPAFVDEHGRALDEDELEVRMRRLQQGEDAPLWLAYRKSNVKVEGVAASAVPTRFGFEPHPSGDGSQPEAPATLTS